METLAWCETPWDTMDKQALEKEVEQMFTALEKAENVLMNFLNLNALFFLPAGPGGRSLSKASEGIDRFINEDTFTKETFIRHAQRMYAALTSSYSVMKQLQLETKESSYWDSEQEGGIAFQLVNDILLPLHEKVNENELYYNFFRYANELLFQDQVKTSIWLVCPTCKQMYGFGNQDDIGKPCHEIDLFVKECKGNVRKLEWEDLQTFAIQT